MKPILEHIRANLMTVLAGVQPSAGFAQSFDVEAFRKLGNTPAPYRLVVRQLSPTKDDAAETPMGFIQWRQPFELLAYIYDSETSGVDLDQRINVARSDIEKAVMVDPTRGGYAQDTIIEDPVLIETPECSGVVVNVTVLYRTGYDDPFSKT